jgi:propanol-preferring alcohol dehydrogenase
MSLVSGPRKTGNFHQFFTISPLTFHFSFTGYLLHLKLSTMLPAADSCFTGCGPRQIADGSSFRTLYQGCVVQQDRKKEESAMKAAVVHDFTSPLRLEDIPKPEPGPGQIVVKIEASGLCHTDIHAAHGDWPVKPDLPLIPGHEGVGIVESVGPGVTTVTKGERVAIPWLGYACGTCEYCVSGWETLCLSQRNTGYFLAGAYAEYAPAFANYVTKVPAGINPLEAAPLTCAGVTTYKAVKVSGARPSDLVAIFGIGGLGHLAMQYAKIAGAAVVAVDLVNEKLQLARELGADYTINARNEDPVEAIQKLGGADASISTAVSPRAFEQAYKALRRGGTMVFVALPADNYIQLPIFETVLNGLKIVGSIVGTRRDLAEVFELHAAGRTKVVYETRNLDDVNHAFEEVEKAQVAARLVFNMA